MVSLFYFLCFDYFVYMILFYVSIISFLVSGSVIGPIACYYIITIIMQFFRLHCCVCVAVVPNGEV